MFNRRGFVHSLLALLPIPFLKRKEIEKPLDIGITKASLEEACKIIENLRNSLRNSLETQKAECDAIVTNGFKEINKYGEFFVRFDGENQSEMLLNPYTFIPELVVRFNIEGVADGLTIMGEQEMARHLGMAVIAECKLQWEKRNNGEGIQLNLGDLKLMQ